MRRGLVLIGCFLTLAYTAAAQYRGASNYAWYSNNGSFWANGVIRHYHLKGVRPLVQSQLREMYTNGQRRLRIPIFHGTNETDCSTARLGDGTAIRSFSGWIDPVCHGNLRNFLADIKAQNFEEVLVGFFPAGRNDPKGWDVWDEQRFEDNWNCIRTIRQTLLIRSGLAYKVELGNEQAPNSWQPVLLQYTQRMWGNYTHDFDRTDTVGFSIICGTADGWPGCHDRLKQLSRVYGDNYPYWFSFHYIGEDQALYDKAWAWMRRHSLVQPWIIGESGYNSTTEAENLRQSQMRNGNVILWIAQWPNANPPVGFQAYTDQGF